MFLKEKSVIFCDRCEMRSNFGSLLAIFTTIFILSCGANDIPADVEVNENIEQTNNEKSGKLQYDNYGYYGALDYDPESGNYDYGE